MAKLIAFAVCFLIAVSQSACASAAIEPGPCKSQSFEGSGFVVCAFDATSQELRIVTAGKNGANLRSLEALAQALGADANRVRFAMNAGMFDEDGGPIGLTIENGVTRHAISTSDGPGNFHMKPNGIFSHDDQGALHIDTSKSFIARGGSARWATQSGPMLVIQGALHPKIQHDGESRYIRNGVGLRAGHTALFVISHGPVSFGKLARFFRDKLGCMDALYFDGSVSSLWAPSLERMDKRRPLGPMVVVLDRPSTP